MTQDQPDADRVVVVAAAAAPAEQEEAQAEVAHAARSTPTSRDRDRRDEDVVVLHVAQLVGQHPFELDPVHLLEQAGGDRERTRASGSRPVAKAFGAGSSTTYSRGLGRPAGDAQPLDEVVVAGAYSGPSAGLAWLAASATLSEFQYETNDATRDDDHDRDRHDRDAGLEQEAQREGDEPRSAARRLNEQHEQCGACSA